MSSTSLCGELSDGCARSSTDRASDYGSEGWGFESLRAHNATRPTSWGGFFVARTSARDAVPRRPAIRAIPVAARRTTPRRVEVLSPPREVGRVPWRGRGRAASYRCRTHRGRRPRPARCGRRAGGGWSEWGCRVRQTVWTSCVSLRCSGRAVPFLARSAVNIRRLVRRRTSQYPARPGPAPPHVRRRGVMPLSLIHISEPTRPY